jgi:hypothetical protein
VNPKGLASQFISENHYDYESKYNNVKGFPVSINTFLTVFFATFMAIGAFILAFSLLGVMDSMEISEWPSTEGTVTSGDVYSEWFSSGKHISDGYYLYYPRVTYTYNVSGAEYQCDNIWRLDHQSKIPNEAYGVIYSYPQGMNVTVYYDPSDPSQAVLDRSEEVSPLAAVAVGVALLALGVGGIIYVLRRQRRK